METKGPMVRGRKNLLLFHTSLAPHYAPYIPEKQLQMRSTDFIYFVPFR